MNILLSEQLKKLRREKGNTQEDLANHLGISAQAVSKWEREEDGCLSSHKYKFVIKTLRRCSQGRRMRKQRRLSPKG